MQTSYYLMKQFGGYIWILNYLCSAWLKLAHFIYGPHKQGSEARYLVPSAVHAHMLVDEDGPLFSLL